MLIDFFAVCKNAEIRTNQRQIKCRKVAEKVMLSGKQRHFTPVTEVTTQNKMSAADTRGGVQCHCEEICSKTKAVTFAYNHNFKIF